MDILNEDFKPLVISLLFNIAVAQRAQNALMIDLLANDNEVKNIYDSFLEFLKQEEAHVYAELFARFAHVDLSDLLSPDKS